LVCHAAHDRLVATIGPRRSRPGKRSRGWCRLDRCRRTEILQRRSRDARRRMRSGCARASAAVGRPRGDSKGPARAQAGIGPLVDDRVELKARVRAWFLACGTNAPRRRRAQVGGVAGRAECVTQRRHLPRRRRQPHARRTGRGGACEVETVRRGGRSVASRRAEKIPATPAAWWRCPRRTSTCCASASDLGSTSSRFDFVRSAEDVEYVRTAHTATAVAKDRESNRQSTTPRRSSAPHEHGWSRAAIWGIELPIEDVPIRPEAEAAAADRGRSPARTITPQPDARLIGVLLATTRAGGDDVAQTILDGTTRDASQRRSSAAYPVEAVEMMARIAERNEEAALPGGNETRGRRDARPGVNDRYSAMRGRPRLGLAALVRATLSGRAARPHLRAPPPCPSTASRPAARRCGAAATSCGRAGPSRSARQEVTEELIADSARRRGGARIGSTRTADRHHAGLPKGRPGTTGACSRLRAL